MMKLLNGIESLGSGLLIGTGAVILFPFVAPFFKSALKFLTKETMKISLITYQTVKNVTEETGKSFKNIASEAKAEIAK